MKIVVLSVCDAVDVHVIQRLEVVEPTMEIVRIVFGSHPPSGQARLLSKVSITKLIDRAESSFRDWRSTRTHKQISQLLFGAHEPPIPRAREEISAWEINNQQSADLIRKLAPDILLVTGAPILKATIYSIPKLAAINVHYGVAPHYRGENTLFWPLYYGDFERIGVTLHQIGERIDAGRIFAVGRPALEPNDTEATLFAKCACLAAELIVEILDTARSGSLVSEVQQAGGHLFLSRDRRFWHDFRYQLARLVRKRSLTIPPKRVVKHFSAT